MPLNRTDVGVIPAEFGKLYMPCIVTVNASVNSKAWILALIAGINSVFILSRAVTLRGEVPDASPVSRRSVARDLLPQIRCATSVKRGVNSPPRPPLEPPKSMFWVHPGPG